MQRSSLKSNKLGLKTASNATMRKTSEKARGSRQGNTEKSLRFVFAHFIFVFVLYIIFAVPTKFLTKPKSSVTAYRNWDTYLQCDIFGYPFPVITWTRSLKQLPVGRHVIDGKNLTIKNTTEQDGGAYVCQGTNGLGSVMAVIWIFLKDAGKLRI